MPDFETEVQKRLDALTAEFGPPNDEADVRIRRKLCEVAVMTQGPIVSVPVKAAH